MNIPRLLGCILLIGSALTVHAAPAKPPPASPAPPAQPIPDNVRQADEFYTQGTAALAKKDYPGAIKLFAQADKLNPNNPDILNELAYSNRKAGNLDLAFTLYDKALKLRPKFPEAREYLGEAHLQAALREIETLKSYGKDGEEELGELTKAFKETAAKLSESGNPRTTSGGW